LSLNAGATYGIIIDGKQAAQCDFQMILTTSPTINPPLPFHFDQLTAKLSNGLPELSWAINTVADLDRFVIERSFDGLHFASFGERLAATEQWAYTWTDHQAAAGTNYYRIVAVDKNGSKTYSDRLALAVELPSFAIQSLWYQPSQLHFAYTYGEDLPLVWQILDITGRKLESGYLATLRGTSSQVLATHDLAPGVYLLSLQSEKGRLSRKFLVE